MLASIVALVSRKAGPRKRGLSRPRFRPTLERLEDRLAPADLTVNSRGDADVRDDQLTLREALLIATGALSPFSLTDRENAQVVLGANPFSYNILFNIGGGGPQTILINDNLPANFRDVTIDGTSQPGYVNAPLIELRGLGGITGLVLQDRNTVRGLAINSFAPLPGLSGGIHAGIYVAGGGNVIEANYIGTDLSGALALPNQYGIVLDRETGNLVGGEQQTRVVNGRTVFTRNVISGNETGVWIKDSVGHNKVRHNFIGPGPDALTFQPPVHDNQGTPTPGGNRQDGILITGLAPGTIRDNVIAFNGRSGLGIAAGVRVSEFDDVSNNAIFSNTGLGIDLGLDGVTLNDSQDADTGAGELQNYPVLTSVVVGAGKTTIRGTLNSTPNSRFRLEFYQNPTDIGHNPSGFGEGRFFLDALEVTTNNAGDADFELVLNYEIPEGRWVSAIARETGGFWRNFSEFSPALPVLGGVVQNFGDLLVALRPSSNLVPTRDDPNRPKLRATITVLIRQASGVYRPAADGDITVHLT